MAKKCETGQAARRARWLPAVLAGGLGLLAGCSNQPVVNAPQPADPLHGVLTPPGMPQPASAPKATAASTQPPTQQFGAADNSSTNNATLAGMTWQGPLGKPLAIDDTGSKTPTPGTLTTGSKSQPLAPGFIAPNASPKVEAIPDARPTAPSITPTSGWQSADPQAAATPTVTAPPPSDDALTKQLQDRGVTKQKLDQVTGGVVLTCCIPRPDGGLRILTSDKEKPAPDYAAAAQAIIQQIDAGKQTP